MDIDEFLDRELSDLGLQPDKTEKDSIELPELSRGFEESPLLESIKSSLSKGDIDLAEQSYAQLWRILTQQKLKWNRELYEQIYILSRQFSSALNYAYNDVKRKADQVYELIGRAKSALKEGKNELPFKIYSEIEGINNSIPNVFFEEKRIIQGQIMEFYKELKNTTDNELIKRVNALVQEINALLEKIGNAVKLNDIANAIVNYNRCIELYNQVPEGFLKHKNNIGMRILGIYKSLSIYTEISSLQKQLADGIQAPGTPANNMHKTMLLNAKKERAKKNTEKGFYNEASKNIEEALQIEPNDAEARALRAKIKTLQ